MANPIIMPYKGISPILEEGVFVAPASVVIGDTVLAKNVSVWFNVTIRGDVNYIRIGENTNIQDGTTCHVTYKTHPLVIGQNVTVGHNAILHGCTVGNSCLIGMGATIMDGAVIEDDCMIAAGAVVTPNKTVKTGEVWSGFPARKMRDMNDDDRSFIAGNAKHYVSLASEYK
jgi:carbonic anhydrase/acetyltransferase-like protein (isoleucine patch superfamily)